MVTCEHKYWRRYRFGGVVDVLCLYCNEKLSDDVETTTRTCRYGIEWVQPVAAAIARCEHEPNQVTKDAIEEARNLNDTR